MNNLQDVFSEKFLSELDRITNVGFVIEDYPSGKILYATKSMSNVFGYEEGYFLGKGLDLFISITHPEDVARMVNEMAMYMNQFLLPGFDYSKIQTYTFEGRQRHKEGHWIWTEQHSNILTFTPEGQPNLVIATSKEISERKMGEDFLWQELVKREPSEEKVKQLWAKFQQMKTGLINVPFLEAISPISLRMDPMQNLSEREKEILKLISKGLSSKEIADELKISFHTAEKHRKNILQKFEVKNTAELIKEAGRSYWLGN